MATGRTTGSTDTVSKPGQMAQVMKVPLITVRSEQSEHLSGETDPRIPVNSTTIISTRQESILGETKKGYEGEWKINKMHVQEFFSC